MIELVFTYPPFRGFHQKFGIIVFVCEKCVERDTNGRAFRSYFRIANLNYFLLEDGAHARLDRLRVATNPLSKCIFADFARRHFKHRHHAIRVARDEFETIERKK